MSTTRITHLDIAGFKSIEAASLDLGQVNVLIGANGAGKSNLLSFLRMLQWLANHDLRGFVFKSGGPNMLLRFGAKTTPQMGVKMTLVNADGTECVYDATLSHAMPEFLLIESEQLHEPGSEAAPDGPHRESHFASRDKSNGDPSGSLMRFLRQVRIHHFHDTSNLAPIRQNCDLDDNHSLHEDGGNLAALLYRLQKSAGEALGRIESTIEQAAPFFNGFSLVPQKMDVNRIHLRWREKGHDEDFHVQYLSDGTLRFIALTTLLLQPEADLPPVIILDEPELGLHPYAIALLASMIHHAANYRQVIIATQSKELLDHFEADDVVVVERRERATEFRRLSATELAEWLEEYTLGELWDSNVFGGRPSAWHG